MNQSGKTAKSPPIQRKFLNMGNIIAKICYNIDRCRPEDEVEIHILPVLIMLVNSPHHPLDLVLNHAFQLEDSARREQRTQDAALPFVVAWIGDIED